MLHSSKAAFTPVPYFILKNIRDSEREKVAWASSTEEEAGAQPQKADLKILWVTLLLNSDKLFYIFVFCWILHQG